MSEKIGKKCRIVKTRISLKWVKYVFGKQGFMSVAPWLLSCDFPRNVLNFSVMTLKRFSLMIEEVFL
jgi:hypothetical protein